TEAFLRAVYHLFFGKADPERIDADINFARTYADKDAMPVLLAYIRQGKIDAAFDWARPKSKYYQWLKVGLDRYRSYRTAGGWSSIPAGDALKPGLTDPRVATLRKRLAVTADLPADGAETNDTAVFDPQLEAAVKVFQTRHGLDVDGIVGPDTLNAMNVPVSERIEKIRVNLERGRWILHEAYEEYLVADIAGFHIFWATGEESIWKEQIQVGQAYTKTPVFKGEIRYLDFNPTWTIPPGILKRSVIPGLKRDPDYLSKKGYRLLTPKGQPVDPKTVNWKALKGFPYIVRQPPGPNNALGQVKFLFPNPHYVFLHDTNHRELFDLTKRTFSSGCIRVRNPLDLAERLLAGQENWTRKRIEAVVASGKTTRVILKRPMRILIAYNTAHVPTAGAQVHFREDIYQRDTAVLAALEGPFRLHRRDEK
ncbi:MAG: L,D-transpeptidase family protein, partial [Desulfosarcina sp.]